MATKKLTQNYFKTKYLFLKSMTNRTLWVSYSDSSALKGSFIYNELVAQPF